MKVRHRLLLCALSAVAAAPATAFSHAACPAGPVATACPIESSSARARRGASIQLAQTQVEQVVRTGTVKFYNAKKGFGFISPDDGDKDVIVLAFYVKASGLDSLTEGQRVEYKLGSQEGRPPFAVEIHLKP